MSEDKWKTAAQLLAVLMVVGVLLAVILGSGAIERYDRRIEDLEQALETQKSDRDKGWTVHRGTREELKTCQKTLKEGFLSGSSEMKAQRLREQIEWLTDEILSGESAKAGYCGAEQ